MKTDVFNYHFSNCEKNGVSIYPKYVKKDCKIGNKYFKGNSWYVCANNNGREIYYDKVIGTGLTLSSKKNNTRKRKVEAYDWQDAIKKTYKYWSDKIDNL